VQWLKLFISTCGGVENHIGIECGNDQRCRHGMYTNQRQKICLTSHGEFVLWLLPFLVRVTALVSPTPTPLKVNMMIMGLFSKFYFEWSGCMESEFVFCFFVFISLLATYKN
jgi:hypothetical protein